MRPDRQHPGGELLVIEDWGVGMPPEDLAAANAILAKAVDVDLSVAQRLGFHVVARLSARHGIGVTLSPTPASGTTAVVALPATLFEDDADRLRLGGGIHRVAATGGTETSAVGTAVRVRPRDGGGAHELRVDGDEPLPDRWGPHEPAADPAVPDQRRGPEWFGDDAGQYIGSRRREPQSHLAAELRAPGAAGPDSPALPRAHVTGAAQALSRFHSGRRAAEARGDDARPEGAGAAWFEPAPPDAEPEPGTGR
jgi:hypothetical protein